MLDSLYSFNTNTHASMGFSDSEALQKFTVKTSARLASMLHVLMQVHQDVDGGFMTNMLEVANDMAYQVQQAVELMAANTGKEATA
jgi:hypothetical protein